jgi:hypothetical protein
MWIRVVNLVSHEAPRYPVDCSCLCRHRSLSEYNDDLTLPITYLESNSDRSFRIPYICVDLQIMYKILLRTSIHFNDIDMQINNHWNSQNFS